MWGLPPRAAAPDPGDGDQGPQPGPDRAQAVARMVRSVSLQPEVSDGRVVEALRRVPRDRFVPPELRRWAWEDRALDIGHGQTISAPHMVGIMASLLALRPGDKVLEVGTGSGYHAAVLAELVRGDDQTPDGHVYSIEYVPPLAERARAHLEDAGYGDLVTVTSGDGGLGWPAHAPFDRISVAAAAPSVPEPLKEQLAPGGRMVIPVGQQACDLVVIERNRTGLHSHVHGQCLFVPLVGRHGSAAARGLVWDNEDVDRG